MTNRCRPGVTEPPPAAHTAASVATPTWPSEYDVLCRQWGRAQRHAEAARRQWQATLQAQSAEIVRLRGRLLTIQTALLWGLRASALWLATPLRVHSTSAGSPTATSDSKDPWCQVACEGHAHVFLANNGNCRLSGEQCQTAGTGTGTPDSPAQPHQEGSPIMLCK